MRYLLLATDYDGTIADNEKVSVDTLDALIRLKATGRTLILVTGRELKSLQEVFPDYLLFDLIVAENGAMIYYPGSQKKILLGERPPESFLQQLRDKGIPFSVGEVIVATWEPHQDFVLEAIKTAGLEHQVIFNKGAVMVLPPGLNKSTGLHRALKEINFSEHNVVAVGDAENDNAMLQSSECAIAVGNALLTLKQNADWVTLGQSGEGVRELIERLIYGDLKDLDKQLSRHYLELGKKADGSSFEISPYGKNILLTGTSGCGKTTLAAAFTEKLIQRKYQFCLIDPEGDYQDLPGAITIGDSSQPPLIDHVITVLSQTDENAIVCFLSIPLNERPEYFKKLSDALAQLRQTKGHPHFIIIDEAHHLMPAEGSSGPQVQFKNYNNILAITTKPELLCTDFLKDLGMVLIMGKSPQKALASFALITQREINPTLSTSFDDRDVLVWREDQKELMTFKSNEPGKLLMRHKRKYASGDMYANSFYFTGPGHKMNLKANNLMTFIQIAKDVDDQTWMYHLQRNDYSNWIRHAVKDPGLAKNTKVVEDSHPEASQSRKAIAKLILNRYTLPS